MTEETDNRDDVLLGAYLDGELPEDQASELTERLAHEPRLMRRLEAMRSADVAARQVFASLDEVPMPDEILGLFDRAPEQSTAEVIPFPTRIVQSFVQMPVAIAASVALVVGFLVNDLVDEAPETSGRIDLYQARTVDANSALHELLEHGVSAEPRPLSDAASARLLLTFEDKSGEYCRQLHIDAGRDSGHGVACRRRGHWQIEAFAFTAAETAGGPYRAASGETSAAIESVIDALIGSRDPLGRDEEKQIISTGWKNSGQ